MNSKSNLFFGYTALLILFIVVVVIVQIQSNKTQCDSNSDIPQDENILISQYDLKKDYGWQDIILWAESKENFEKAYNTKLNWLNYAMGFQRDPMCTDPLGGGGEWKYEKVCFNFVWRPNIPNMLDKIAVQTRGKTLVIIGTIHDNAQRFSGDVYWCE
ncbi:hypothetical protein K9M48_02440 [Candidatus Gracilibacteria bacterium]|nr:hypothetical protein [Candidatus Gracilibacteria bacterium]